jgi:hypothetical protein
MRLFGLIFLFNKFFHGFFVLFLKVSGDLGDHFGQRIWLRILLFGLRVFIGLLWRVHGFDELEHGVSG